MQAGVESHREAFLEALLSADPRAAEIVVRQAMAGGLGELEISDRVITPALRSVNELSEGGLISAADEQAASHISMRVLALQREAFRRELQRGGEEVLLAELEGDPPSRRLAAAAVRLREAGFRVRLLGTGVPVLSLARTVAQRRPHAVVLNVTTRNVGSLLDHVLDEIDLAAGETRVVVGGPGVPTHLDEDECLTTWESPREIVAKVDSLVLRPALN